MKYRALKLFLILALLSSCGGRTPAPVKVTNASDSLLSCNQIAAEINLIDMQAQRLGGKSNKQPKNIGLTAAGYFFIVPFFFIDLKEAEKVELNALRARYFHLTRLASNNKCSGFSDNNKEEQLEGLLNNLKLLLDKGVLTKKEYEMKRKEVIAQFDFESL